MSRPDSTSPREKPLAPKTVYTLNARFRIGPSGNVVVSRDMLAGAVNAAATPLTGRKFRAQDLAEAVHLSQSALSRLVDRLARHGLVERCGCDVDRRGVYVVLTEAGERCHTEAVPTHRDVLSRLLPASMLSAASSAR